MIMITNKERILICLREYEESFTAEEPSGVTTQYLSKMLHIQRSNISTILNGLEKERVVEKIAGRPVLYRLRKTVKDAEPCFSTLIGYDRSLRHAVQLAKAAVLYPNHSLHSLIMGASGSGKASFARVMYQFAIETKKIPEQAPYLFFDCRTYADDTENKDYDALFKDFENSMLAQANYGVLILHHIEYLSLKAREYIFHLLENGLHMHGKTYSIFFICTIDSSCETVLQDTFSSRFSILIHLPSLLEKDIKERYDLVQHFFTLEALQTNLTLELDAQAMRSLLLYECSGNVKQLRKDIQIGCANAYAREYGIDKKELVLSIADFPFYVRKGFLNYKQHRPVVDLCIQQGCTYRFSNENLQNEIILTEQTERNIYDIINQKCEELRNRGIDEYDINRLVSVDIENEFKEYSQRISNTIINKEQLSKVVDPEIITLVDDFLERASRTFECVYPVSVFYGLCLHLSSTLKNPSKTQHLSNERIMEIVERYKEEYAFCMKFMTTLEEQFQIHQPIDEVIFITMFITDPKTQFLPEEEIQVVLAMHGKGNATSMADVVNTLVRANNVYAYDLELDKDMKTAYEELKQFLQSIYQGKGILFLYDMGSLKTMAESIMQECNIPMRLLALPATLLAMDCARKAANASSLDNLYQTIMESYDASIQHNEEAYPRTFDKQIIITLCMSGKGGAVQMKHYIERYVKQDDIDVLPYAISDREYLLQEINFLRKKSHILCVVGTYDPKLYGIPFVSIAQLYEVKQEDLRHILFSANKKEILEKDHYHEICESLKEDMDEELVNKIETVLCPMMQKLKQLLPTLKLEQELGLFMHIACAIEHSIKGEATKVNRQKKTILTRHKRLYLQLREWLQPIETTFSIQFHDDEISYLIMSIKNL